ncbi:hypothetical protein ES703_68285 [subsurface metagenome]
MDFILNPNLVLYLPLYKLDGSSFMSKDACGHLCTVTGALWTPQGRKFDGTDDKIDCGNNSVLNPADAITIEVWVYDQTTATEMLLSRGARDGTYTGSYIIRDGTGSLTFRLNDAAFVSNAVVVTQNKWEHVVFTYNKVSVIGYLNGVAGTPKAYATAIASDNYATVLGWGHGAGYYYQGLIGECRIYNRALTPIEIQSIYLATRWRYR